MLTSQKILTIIPARGGSKGCPHKNKRLLRGKPLVSWTIEAALKSQICENIVVSSDDKDILEIASSFINVMSLERPAKLATDEASSLSVVRHAIETFSQNNTLFTHVILLQPTSPFRTAEHIDAAFSHMKHCKASSCVSIVEVEHSPYLSFFLNAQQKPKFILKRLVSTRRQDIPLVFTTNGAIYITEIEDILRKNEFFSEESATFIMNQKSSLDIDTELDFEIADYFARHIGAHSK